MMPVYEMPLHNTFGSRDDKPKDEAKPQFDENNLKDVTPEPLLIEGK